MLFIVFLFLTSIFGVIYGSVSKSLIINKVKLASAQVVVKSIPTPIVTPTPILTPTSSLAPTPVYTGFCLNVPVLMHHHVEPWSIIGAIVLF